MNNDKFNYFGKGCSHDDKGGEIKCHPKECPILINLIAKISYETTILC